MAGRRKSRSEARHERLTGYRKHRGSSAKSYTVHRKRGGGRRGRKPGYHHSNETRRKISEGMKRYWASRGRGRRKAMSRAILSRTRGGSSKRSSSGNKPWHYDFNRGGKKYRIHIARGRRGGRRRGRRGGRRHRR